MAGQNRSAGYCVHCQRGVTIIRPTGDGFFGRIRAVVANNEDSWVCSKCGNPATKGFTPPIDTLPETPENSPQADQGQAVAPDSPTTSPARENQVSNVYDTEMNDTTTFSVANVPAEPSGSEAICHLCNYSIPFNPKDSCSAITCPGCQSSINLPDPDNGSLMTSSPAIIKLKDDPDRPAISKSLCTLCQFEMTYPKKLRGKEVDCPSCDSHFQLP